MTATTPPRVRGSRRRRAESETNNCSVRNSSRPQQQQQQHQFDEQAGSRRLEAAARSKFGAAARNAFGREGRAEVFASEGSGRISGLSWAEGLVELEDGERHIRPGDPVRYIPFGSFAL